MKLVLASQDVDKLSFALNTFITFLSNCINKATALNLMSLDHISRHTHTHTQHTHTHTDGSKAENVVAAAYTIPTLNLNKQFRLCNSSSIYAAELTAIKEVFSWISENETQDLKNFAIFSDSLSVLTSFKNSFSESRP